MAWADAQAHGGAAASGGARFTALTKPQADVVEAMTARILPAVDGRPGAREAGAIHFIDRALATFNAAQKTLYVDGVADLGRRAAALGAAVRETGTHVVLGGGRPVGVIRACF